MTELSAHLAFRRPGFDLRLRLALPGAGITALLGPSGGGKSTLLRLLAGLERPRAGHIRHRQRLWYARAAGIDLAPRRRDLGFMFQDHALFPHLSVAENIGYGLARAPDRAARVAHWIERVGLGGLARRRPGQLSGGQRQRVALARALAPAPALLLLDEPFSALDASLRQSLRLLVQELIAETATCALLVTHDIEDARQCADRIGVMIDGRLRRLDEAEAVFAAPGDAEVARVLGWPNTLAVTRWEGRAACGPWGRVELARAPRREDSVVALLPDGPRPGARAGLAVEIARVIDMGPYRALSCRLPDRTALRIHLPRALPCPARGEHTLLDVPPGCAIALPAGTAKTIQSTRY
ncbi:ABC transporter ATP-binding protein [Marichromatium gracile]|uniref:ABC transporter n=1 Tax=Marichromatium gracile TaxID=1048 RepID=A0ABR5VFX1_MARGR|nr:ABC transporter ATP-binding protein [Marichromatium gracile]KXX64002.1 ABC transporter [Marichromatium gracile]